MSVPPQVCSTSSGCARRQFLQQFRFGHPVLERLGAIDRDHRYFLVIDAVQPGVGVDIDLFQFESNSPANAFQHAFRFFAKTAARARVQRDFRLLRHYQVMSRRRV